VTERFIYNVPVRWSDMDAYGHVNNARFLTLYEEARVELFFVHARKFGLGSLEEGSVIARHEVDYLRPVDYGDRSRIELWISEIRPSRFVVDYEFFADDELAGRARSVCVPFDLATGRPRRLSDAERKYLAPWAG
jgi:acyl-CoA thioester hydrolase